MDIPVTPGQLHEYLNSSEPIQVTLTHLTADQREFIMTGITPEEWKAAFPGDDEDEAPMPFGLEHIVPESIYELGKNAIPFALGRNRRARRARGLDS